MSDEEEDQIVEWLIQALLDAGIASQPDERIQYDQAA